MSVKVASFSRFSGGMSQDPREGVAGSFAYGQAWDFRKYPTQLSVLPRLVREDGGVVRDLVLKEVMTASGTIYAYGDSGYFYKRSTAGQWSMESKLTTGFGGLDYRQDADAIYLTSAKTASLYNQVSGNPQMFPDYYGPSFSTYNNTETMGFNVNAYQVGSPLTTTLTTSIVENDANRRFLQTDIEPLVKVSVFIVSKGTGDLTLTLHDGLNNVLGTKTVLNSNITNNTWLDFYFTAAPNQQVRVYPAPNARTYHVHVTSTVTDATISSSITNDMSSIDLQVWADRFVVTNNGLHPLIRFQQFEAFGNANYLSIWEPITDVPTNDEWRRHQLTFPQEYEVCGLATNNEFLIIGAGKTTVRNTSTPQEGILFFWSGSDPNKYDYFVEIPEGTPTALKTYKNVTYFVAGGAWYALTSAETQPVKLRTLPGSDNEYSGLQSELDALSPTPSGVQAFTSDGTFTVPIGVTNIRVAAIGGGGGGSSRTNLGTPISARGAGGGGAGYASSILNVTPGTVHAVVVGQGGAGSVGNASPGTDSSFDTTIVVASRGFGATGGTVAAVRGIGGNAANVGSIKFPGGNGAQATGTLNFAGGGGESGSATGGGNVGQADTGAGGTGGDGGDGGAGGALSFAGSNGMVPGGAGGGGYSTNALPGATGYRSGGSGARGEVRITYGALRAASLIDNFSGTSSTPNTTRWVSFGNYSQANGSLSLTTSTAISTNGLRSVLDYNLVSSSLQVRLVNAGNQSLTSLNVYPVLAQIDSSNQIFWVVTNNLIKAVKVVGGASTIVASTTYVANTFQYLRLRESQGTIYWDYSLDGVSWLNFTSTLNPFGVQMLQVYVEVDNTGAEAGATTVVVDEFNVLVSSDYTVSYPDLMTVRRGVLMLGYPAKTTNTATNYGVYSWGAVDKNYPNSFGYSYLLSTESQNVNDTNNLTIGMVKSFGDLMHVAWRDDLISGTPRYGVDVVSNISPPAPTAIYDTLIVTNSYTAKYKSGLFVEAYFDLPSGSSIRLSYSIDQGDFVDDDVVYTSTNLWQYQTGYARFSINTSLGNGGRFHELKGRVTITSDSNTRRSPIVQEINIAYDDLREEEVQ